MVIATTTNEESTTTSNIPTTLTEQLRTIQGLYSDDEMAQWLVLLTKNLMNGNSCLISSSEILRSSRSKHIV